MYVHWEFLRWGAFCSLIVVVLFVVGGVRVCVLDMARGQVQIEGEVAEPSGDESAWLFVRSNASVAEYQMNQCVTASLSSRGDNHGLKLLQL